MEEYVWKIDGPGYAELSTALTFAIADTGSTIHTLTFPEETPEAMDSAKYAMVRRVRCFFGEYDKALPVRGFRPGIMSREFRKIKKKNKGFNVLSLTRGNAGSTVAKNIEEVDGIVFKEFPKHIPGFAHRVTPQFDVAVRIPGGTFTGLAVLEAMAIGLVPVVPEGSVDTKYVKHGRTGFVYASPEEAAELVAGLRDDMSKGGKLYHKLSRNAMLAASWHDWRIVYPEWQALMRRIR